MDVAAAPGPLRRRDLVAVGASAGGVEALTTLVGALPGDLPATVLVALHLPASARSHLADVLARSCDLRVREALPGLPLVPGEVVVAAQDAHLLVVHDRIVLGSGPREHGSRPSHDAMLRSVALARRNRVVGAVLTGLLDDGAAGLAVVARYGGHCLVQDPAEAEFSSMPTAALRAVPTARSLPLLALAAEVVRAVTEVPTPEPLVCEQQWQRDLAELDSALGRSRVLADGNPASGPTRYDRPDGDVEEALRTALRVLEERAEMNRRLAGLATTNRREWSQEHFLSRASAAERSAGLLRSVLRREGAPSPETPTSPPAPVAP